MHSATDPCPKTRVLTLMDRVGADDGARRLAAALRQTPPTPGLLRIEQRVEDVDALMWLTGFGEPRRFHFAGRDRAEAVSGLGVAVGFEGSLGGARAWLSALFATDGADALRVLVTSRFDDETGADSTWAPFGGLRLALPRLELRRTAAGTTLAVHVLGDDRADVLRLLDAPAAPAVTTAFTAVVVGEQPDIGGWTDAVTSVLSEIRSGTLEKCVLARTRTYALDGRVDPFALLGRAGHSQPDTFLFGVQVAPGTVFVGATPELLFRRRGRQVESEALAGTRWCPPSGDAGDELEGDLLDSVKDRAEHEFVTVHVREALRPLLDDEPKVDGLRVRRLPELLHLDARVSGVLKTEASDLDLLGALHPTPAVCGVPSEHAHGTIRTHERFDRGLYGGAVGLLGRDESVVVVGIRSALFSNDHVTLFAGAGIVQGSEPDAEWEETGDKMRALDATLRAGHAG